MRIDKFAVRSAWKNLKGFTIDFDEGRDVAVLIGKNGSAKSNLLEAIIRVFRDIDLEEPSPFEYSIDYRLADRDVHVEARVDQRATGTVDGNVISSDDLKMTWTPKYVVGYYSGTSDRFAELFQKHDRIALGETLAGTTEGQKLGLRRFICARPVHGLFALLAFYFSDDREVMEFLGEFPKIQSFDSALLVLQKPNWARKGASSNDLWGARGPVRELIERFREHSLAPFTQTISVATDFRRRQTREFMYLYLPDLEALHDVAGKYGSDPKSFFQALDTMRLSELVRDFRIRVRVKGAGAIHTRQLSEGEQQLLTVLGLMRFTRNEESLYILDEPDTHLNPAWGLEYLDHLRKVGGVDKESHTLLATHDPLLVSGLLKEEIRVLYRAENSTIVAVQPDESPRGTGVAGVLTSPLYGLESQLDAFSLRVLKRIYDISKRPGSEDRTRHFRRLRALVPGLVPAESSPDPYRNIARLAYEMTIDTILKSQNSPQWRRESIERLSKFLTEQAGAGLT